MAVIDRTNNVANALSELYRQQKLSKTQPDGKSNAVADAKGGTGQDEVVLSSRSEEVNQIKQQLNQLPEVDEQKVARLREQINNGSYNINSQQVADKILTSGLNPNIR